ncbi:MAG: YqhA family protein [Pikeienuella sp.]
MPKHERLARTLRHGIGVVVWLLLPLVVGLVLLLVFLLVSFYAAMVQAVLAPQGGDRYSVILLVLDLLDMVFVAHLIVMTVVGFYNSYFRAPGRAAAEEDGEEPAIAFAGGLEAMKSHFAVVLVVISGIHLLHEVLAGETGDPARLLGLAVVHVVLLATAVALVWIARADR